MTFQQILTVVEFLCDSITEDQIVRLMDEARQLSIADRERLHASLNGGPLFTELSMNAAEMGGYHLY